MRKIKFGFEDVIWRGGGDESIPRPGDDAVLNIGNLLVVLLDGLLEAVDVGDAGGAEIDALFEGALEDLASVPLGRELHAALGEVPVQRRYAGLQRVLVLLDRVLELQLLNICQQGTQERKM